MVQLLGVHGIAKHQLGRHQLLAAWTPALADGLERAAGRPVRVPPMLDISFYGDLFLPEADPIAAKGINDKEFRSQDLGHQELADLVGAATEAVTPEDLDFAERTATKGYTRLPLPLQVVLRALDRRYGGAAGVLYLGVLRQVRRYLCDPLLKAEVDGRVAAAVDGRCLVLIGHSLGSVVAYEYLRHTRDHGIELLVTAGSPLGLRMVRDRLVVGAVDVPVWVNVRDARDPVTCAGDLRRWWPQAEETLVDNGADAHAAERYLSKLSIGRAVLRVLPELAQ